ncbi:MAG: DUF5337 domain-containing protein [Rhodobacterales bacterium]|nr:DUF5337 domain-containing protein [Rhodobacterales bacterium]
MTQKTDADQSLARQQRAAGFAIAGAMLGWMALQYAGARGVVSARVLFLFDFATLAVMVWALLVTFRVWRKRRADKTR